MPQSTTKAEYDRSRYQREKQRRDESRPPDPILLLTELEKAYIAGLIDGEGSIHMTKRDARRTAYLYVCVTMTHKPTIEWLSEKFGNKAVYVAPPKNRPGLLGKTKPAYSCRLGGKRAKLLSQVLIPYLITKLGHAKLAMEYPEDARIGPGKRLDGTDIAKAREAMKERFAELNNHRYERRQVS